MPCPHFGNYPVEYNRAIHGNYDPRRFYGKPDVPLAEVKVSELGQWLNRRNLHPAAILRGLSRAFHRYEHRFVQPMYSSATRSYHQKVVALCIFFYLINYKTIRHHKQFKYHW